MASRGATSKLARSGPPGSVSLNSCPGVVPVQLIGEGSFHQLHGGTTTNVPMEKRRAQTEAYRQQYLAIRQSDVLMTSKDVHYLGHQPTLASKIARKTYPMPLP